MKTIEFKFYELCEEIDYWKYKAKKAEEDAKYWREEHAKMINESLVSAQRNAVNSILLALSVRENERGDLVVTKEKRKELSNFLNTKK